MPAKSGQSIGQNVSLPRDICYLVEGDTLDIAQDSEVLGISYLCEVFHTSGPAPCSRCLVGVWGRKGGNNNSTWEPTGELQFPHPQGRILCLEEEGWN